MEYGKRVELANKLCNLSIAFEQLAELLNTATADGKTVYECIGDSFCVGYPFEKSFDELAIDVSDWALDILKETMQNK